MSKDETRDDPEQVRRDFEDAVNMTPAELERWLDTEVSKSVGQKDDDGDESVGHAQGRRIVQIKRTSKADLSDQDFRDMRKVVGYVKRHLAQRPDGDITDTRWRSSLKNWGHDPLP